MLEIAMAHFIPRQSLVGISYGIARHIRQSLIYLLSEQLLTFTTKSQFETTFKLLHALSLQPWFYLIHGSNCSKMFYDTAITFKNTKHHT